MRTDRPEGATPAVVLCRPKYPHNVAAAVRAASCWGASQVWCTGRRIRDAVEGLSRIPREERMKGYASVTLAHDDYPFDRFPAGAVPVCVELREGAECLWDFEHPEHAVYVFGPEDGSVPRGVLGLCHRFVFIPTAHCLNLSQAVNAVLLHRAFARYLASDRPAPVLAETLLEDRGWSHPPVLEEVPGWDGK